MNDNEKTGRTGYSISFKLKMNFMYRLFNHFQKKILKTYFAPIQVNRILKNTKSYWKQVLPRIPYIGGKTNFFTQFITSSSVCIPLAKSLKFDEKLPRKTTGEILFKSVDLSIEFLSKLQPSKSRSYLFSHSSLAAWQKRAEQSQKSAYKYDWKCFFIDGEQQPFEFGLDMKECGIVKFWKEEGLNDLTVYMCLTDYLKFDMANMRVDRSQNLAMGCPVCDYRYYDQDSNGFRGLPIEEAPDFQAFPDLLKNHI